ncbi:MAG: DUF790 family protein [Cyanophyceae cyanobacterium]
MLPTELLIHRYQGETLNPHRLPIDEPTRRRAAIAIETVRAHQGKTQGELSKALTELEGSSPDFKVDRGFGHILQKSFCTFEIVSPLEPIALRQRVFETAAKHPPSPSATLGTVEKVARELSEEGEQEVQPDQVRQGLYADLPENRILTTFDAPDIDALIHRYNLSQVQGIFYRASHLVIQAYRNDPGEYKLLFRYLKLFQLMTYIEGDQSQGFTITIDGPSSLFKPSTRYGLAIAKTIPALLHVSKWSLTATLQMKDLYGERRILERQFTLDSNCGLVTHYAPGKVYDSMVEESFVKRWEKTKTEWKLEREVDLVPIPGSVAIPDFRLVHPDGRDLILEIIGYWRPEYLRKKFAQIRKSGRTDWVIAISQRLNLEKAGVNINELPGPVVWFKEKLQPKQVLAVLD